MTENHDPLAAQSADAKLVADIRRELDASCRSLDGQTLSRLNAIRHAALEPRGRKTRPLLLPFGGLVTACVLVLAVTLLNPGRVPDGVEGEAPLQDIDLLVSDEDLDLYEDYEFYQWLADGSASI